MKIGLPNILPLMATLALFAQPGLALAQQRPAQQTAASPSYAVPALPPSRGAQAAIEQVPLSPPSGLKAAPGAAGARPAAVDPRAALRAQVEDELAQLKPRLALAEKEAQEQAERYKEMAASKADVSKKTAEKAETAKARADAAAAKQGYKPKMPGAAGGKKATDAKAAGGDKKGGDAKGGEAGGGAAGGASAAAAKKVDPVLTQQYVVLSLRDQVRQLRERITYLEELKARLGAKS